MSPLPAPERGDCNYTGARRLTIKPAAGAATSVDIYAVGEADISASLLPLVGTMVSVRASFNNQVGHTWYSLLVSDATGPVIYFVNSSSCPGEPYFNTKPSSLASLTVEAGAELCIDDRRERLNLASRFITGAQTVTLALAESGQVTFDGHTFDVHVFACSVTAPGVQGGDGYPAGAWLVTRVN